MNVSESTNPVHLGLTYNRGSISISNLQSAISHEIPYSCGTASRARIRLHWSEQLRRRYSFISAQSKLFITARNAIAIISSQVKIFYASHELHVAMMDDSIGSTMHKLHIFRFKHRSREWISIVLLYIHIDLSELRIIYLRFSVDIFMSFLWDTNQKIVTLRYENNVIETLGPSHLSVDLKVICKCSLRPRK